MSDKQSLFHAPKVLKVEGKWLWPTRIIFLLVSTYFINKAYNAYINGYFYGTNQYYYLKEEPMFFWFMFLMFLLASIGFIWQMFRIKLKT